METTESWLLLALLAGVAELARRLARLRGRVAETERLLIEARDLLGVDWLTGAANRRAFDECLNRVRGRQGLLLLDLDDFKRINDRWGHAAGDRVLRRVAEALRSAVRTEDLVARIGGDEFGVVLGQVEADDLSQLARRIAHAIEWTVDHDGLPAPSAAMGWAMRREGESAAELFARVDGVLYRAKRPEPDGRDAPQRRRRRREPPESGPPGSEPEPDSRDGARMLPFERKS